MKAVFANYYRKPTEYVIHTNVVPAPKRCSNRQFKCLDCGKEWTENINSPQILEKDVENNLERYFENIVYCKDLK